MRSIIEKLKYLKILRYLKGGLKKFSDWVKRSFEHSSTGLIIISILFSASILTGLVHNFFPSSTWFVSAILALIATFLFTELFGCIIKIIFGIKKRNRIYWFLDFSLIFFCILVAAQGENCLSGVLFSIFLTCVVALFGRSLWALFRNRKRTILVFGSLAGSFVSLVLVFALFLSEGFTESYILDYLAMAKEVTVKEDVYQIDAKSQGSFTTTSLIYGMKNNVDLTTRTVDLSSFANRTFPTKSFMRKYFGYDLTEAPLAGNIWYPANEQNCPVIFLIHGNHDYTTDSYLGYDYLGEYLASFGYIVVSVDENCCNSLSNENDARAVLLLENMKYFYELNEDKNSNWYHRFNKEQVAIIGHSRGGEAASVAYLFNRYESYPDDGNISFRYNFNIKSIIAIAPTVDQYQPAEHEVTIENVNYLLLHGANDHDVSKAMGQKQYSNVKFTGEGEYLKSMLYIADANHGQFNTKWGRYDLGYPVNGLLNVANLLDKSSQQTIAKLFIKTFLDVTLKGDQTNIALLKDYERYATSLPKTVYQQTYQTSNFQCICDFDEDSNLNSATMKDAMIHTTGFNEWKEVRQHFGGNPVGENYVLQGNWVNKEGATINITIPEVSLRGRSVVFDVADMREERGKTLLDGTVILSDASGNISSTRISNHTIVYPSLPVQLTKLDYLFGDYEYKHQFQTVTLPVDSFQSEGTAIDMDRIVSLTITFDSSDKGLIQMDNIGIE